MSKPGIKIFIVLIICAAAVVIAFVVLPRVTVNGIGLTPDSVTYIAAAKSLLEGRGFFVGSVPMTHYPPVYSLLLAAGGLFNQDILVSTRWLHTLLYAANAILFMLCIYLGTRKSLAAMIVGGALYFSSPSVLYVHAYALSESPFIFFTLLTFLLLSKYYSSSNWVHLLLASISLGLGIATRYVGIALLPPFLISLFLFSNKPLGKKVLPAVWSTIVAILPIAAWTIRNTILTRSAANRMFVFHLIDFKRIKSMIDTFHNFVFPAFENRWLNGIEIGLVVLAIVYMLYRIFRNRSVLGIVNIESRLFVTLGILFTLSFILVLFLSISFMDAGTSMDERILLPAFLAMTISVFALVDLFSKTSQKPAVIPVFLLCVLFIIRMNIPAAIDRANQMRAEGMGFNAVFWNTSPTISEVNGLPTDARMYSNGFDVLRIKTWRDTIALPRKYDSASTLQNPNYDTELNSLCKEVNEGKALIVYFDQVNWRGYFADENEMVGICNPMLLVDTRDGAIYGSKD